MTKDQYLGFQRGPRPEHPTSANQTRLQASLIRPKHCAIRPQLPAGLGFRQGQGPGVVGRVTARLQREHMDAPRYRNGVTKMAVT